MKLKLLLGALLSLPIVFSANAQHQVKHPYVKKKVVQHKKQQSIKANHKINMTHAIKFLKRTNKVIIVAHNSVKKGHVKKGNLAKAVYHQRYAKKLLKTHKVHRALQHSRIARTYAFRAIRNNKGVVDKEWEFDDTENQAMGDKIADDELDKELMNSDPNISFKDENITQKEMTELEVLETDEADYKNE